MEADGRENIEAGGGFEAHDLYATATAIQPPDDTVQREVRRLGLLRDRLRSHDLGQALRSPRATAGVQHPPTCERRNGYVVACERATTDVALDASPVGIRSRRHARLPVADRLPGPGSSTTCTAPTPTLTVTPPPECDPLCNVR